MKKQRNTQMLVIAVLAIAVLTMSVGFAAFTQRLDINSNTTVGVSTWNVKFLTDSFTVTDGSVNVDSGNIVITGTSVTYEVKLSKPGDFYEFTINVKNSGTFNANLVGITLSSLTEAQSKYLTHKLTYDGVEYTQTTSGLSKTLNATDGVASVKVRVEYVAPEDPNDLPQEEVRIPLTASLSYEQKPD